MSKPQTTNQMSLAEREPVTLAVALTTAVTSTISILLVVGVDPSMVAAITGAASGWIAVAFAWARSKVTPTANVALTVDQVQQLK